MPGTLQFTLGVIIVALQLPLAAVAFVLSQRWLAKRIPAPVLRRGRKNALVCIVVVFVAFSLLAFVISAVFKPPAIFTVVLAFAALWALTFVWFLAAWVHGKNAAGALVLDCGPHPTKLLSLVNAALFLLLFGGAGIASLVQEFGGVGIGIVLLGVSLSAFFLIVATGRLQIRENGIWQYCALLKWDRLLHYQWEGDSLLLHVKTQLPFLGNGALPVSAEQREAINEMLRRHCPAARDA